MFDYENEKLNELKKKVDDKNELIAKLNKEIAKEYAESEGKKSLRALSEKYKMPDNLHLSYGEAFLYLAYSYSLREKYDKLVSETMPKNAMDVMSVLKAMKDYRVDNVVFLDPVMAEYLRYFEVLGAELNTVQVKSEGHRVVDDSPVDMISYGMMVWAC